MTTEELQRLPMGSLLHVGEASQFLVVEHWGNFLIFTEDVLDWLPEEERRFHLGMQRHGTRHLAYTDLARLKVRRIA